MWGKTEIILQAEDEYDNLYKDVDVWVDLEGPNFKKRVYGFWDGENIFKIRITATKSGKWKWVSGSNKSDTGLNDNKGEFIAEEWNEKEKDENPCRRGFIRASENGHVLKYADGTPYFLLGDTWWSTPTYRFKWYDDDEKRPIGPKMGFKVMVKYRKKQGYNSVAMIAAHPTWNNDEYPENIVMDDEDGTIIRSAWNQPGTDSAKDMHNEGGRPFKFPGTVPGYEDVVPNFDRINPEYFQHMDKKIDYLNKQGFIPFIEIARRDVSQVWKKYYEWPESYVRYIQYIFSRYHANNCILSPIHFDLDKDSVSSKKYNEAIYKYIDNYGLPPFGNILSTNAHLTNLRNFGGPKENEWLSLYQIGNWTREHDQFWYLTEIYNHKPAKPGLNGEPYYPGCKLGWPHGNPPKDRKEDNLYCRSSMYGSVLSGGFAGHIYGAQGIWDSAVEEEADPKMWEALEWESGDQMHYLKKFILSEGSKYQELVPNSNWVYPNKTGDHIGFKGWAFCAGTQQRDFFLFYFEKECPDVIFRGSFPERKYKGWWFNPRIGEWEKIEGILTAHESTGLIELPSTPSDNDWGLKLLEIKNNE
ncbi:MAG: DUF4038 domain-containing protein [bacterium]